MRLAAGDRRGDVGAPKRWLIRASVAGATPPSIVHTRAGNVATSISATSRSIARTTARLTCSGLRVPAPTGIRTPVSANMPASRIGPGNTHETPTPVPRRSCRRPEAKPRRPNLVAE